jgi:hypothetical protein
MILERGGGVGALAVLDVAVGVQVGRTLDPRERGPGIRLEAADELAVAVQRSYSSRRIRKRIVVSCAPK